MGKISQTVFGGFAQGIASYGKNDVVGGIKSALNFVAHPIDSIKNMGISSDSINKFMDNTTDLLKNTDVKSITEIATDYDKMLDLQQKKRSVQTRIDCNLAVDILIGSAVSKGNTKAKIPEPARVGNNIDDVIKGGTGSSKNLPALYDPSFAASQVLNNTSNVTSGGRIITVHAAERMIQPPPGRLPTTMAGVDDFLDTATKVQKISNHKLGDTITLRNTNSSIKEVVVDAATGKRVITVINQK